MTSFHGKMLPPISDDKMFEKFVATLWERRNPESSVVFMGRPGQAQYGLDVIVTTRSGTVIGIQCKATHRLSEKTVIDEASKAAQHKPSIDKFILATTAPHDAAIVTVAQRLSEENSDKNLFSIAVFGWGEILRFAEPYPEIVRQFFPEFTSSDQAGANYISLKLDQDLTIPMSDIELALFCSETASSLKKSPNTRVIVSYPVEQSLLQDIGKINDLEIPSIEERTQRSYLEAMLSRIAPRLRRLEIAIPLLLINETIRSPWLIGADWQGTAAVLRRLCISVLRPAFTRPQDALTLKMRSPTNSSILAYLDIEEDDKAAFLTSNPTFSPSFFLGFVPDLGHEIGMKYALPSGIEALLRYSANFDVALDELRKAGEFSIYGWRVEPA
ncbi:restriction endonuclease [Rhizobium sp. TH2]|uniref:restriction endonuclease n=1 Tax=Rhizobium sp. TH2 TaxID=2775403 RepID=UPI0021583B15|nr:restriction endonuclease [Rhizobium sp. TH2]UVC07839.1 restriction endonuclease [Rhizobium sp. TH2]